MKYENVNIPEMEEQRYKKIKASGKYLELTVLIGVNDEEDLGGGQVAKVPVVSTVGKHCGPKEIGCLYMTLKSYMDQMIDDYPSECFAAEMAMHVEDIEQISITRKTYKRED